MPGDLVYFISEEDKLQETLAVFDKDDQPLKRALIVGGGNIGFRLAKSLEKIVFIARSSKIIPTAARKLQKN